MTKQLKSPFPIKLLDPLRNYLAKKEKDLSRRKKKLEAEDPYNNTDRLMDNAAIDTDAAEEFGHERISALKKEIDKALIRIRQTLTKIKVGRYGLCEQCRKMISTDRLAVDPTASLCIECQKKKPVSSSEA